MRTIIAGSRSILDKDSVFEIIDHCAWDISVVISGAAKGIDSLGEEWAELHNVPCEVYPADWTKFGRSAGPRRNTQMAENADALIAIWDGESRGTNNMINTASKKGLIVKVIIVKGD